MEDYVVPKNCRKINFGRNNRRKVKVYIPAKPTWMTDGGSFDDPTYNSAILHPSKSKSYRGSAYSVTKRRPVKPRGEGYDKT